MQVKVLNNAQVVQCETLFEFTTRFGRLESGWEKRLDPEFKSKWVAALLNGKFPQGYNKLYSDGKFCCLGVACMLEELDHYFSAGENGNVFEFGETSSANYLPQAFADELGIPNNGAFQYSFTVDGTTFYGSELLSGLNDNGLSFKQIADVIEYFF